MLTGKNLWSTNIERQNFPLHHLHPLMKFMSRRNMLTQPDIASYCGGLSHKATADHLTRHLCTRRVNQSQRQTPINHNHEHEPHLSVGAFTTQNSYPGLWSFLLLPLAPGCAAISILNMNVVEAPPPSPRSLKRDHEEYASDNKDAIHHSSLLLPEPQLPHTPKPSGLTTDAPFLPSSLSQAPNLFVSNNREASPARSSTGSLTDAGTTTPGAAPSPSAFTKLNGQGPPAKKPKMTFEEKQIQEAIKEVKRREKAEEKAKREAEKAQKEVEKARREAEKETERIKREAEREQKRLVKEAENAEKEKLRKLKEEEKRKKDAEKQRIDDEKKKKERSQPKLAMFFGTPKIVSKEASPAPSNATDPGESPSKQRTKASDKSEYEKSFPPFFIKDYVTLARNRFEEENWDPENVEDEIDAHLRGQKTMQYSVPYNADALFNCPDIHAMPRGKQTISVRDIMREASSSRNQYIDLTTDSQNAKIKHRRMLLSAVPYKTIQFSQDVRPPYRGTLTRHGLTELQKLAKHPTKPQLEDLLYDYDSEAEWVEDGDEDDAEDLISEMGDEEDADDVDADVDDFLDDADDYLANRAKELPADQQPKCSGLCFENERRKGPDMKMYGYHMEIMHGGFSHLIFLMHLLTMI